MENTASLSPLLNLNSLLGTESLNGTDILDRSPTDAPLTSRCRFHAFNSDSVNRSTYSFSSSRAIRTIFSCYHGENGEVLPGLETPVGCLVGNKTLPISAPASTISPSKPTLSVHIMQSWNNHDFDPSVAWVALDLNGKPFTQDCADQKADDNRVVGSWQIDGQDEMPTVPGEKVLYPSGHFRFSKPLGTYSHRRYVGTSESPGMLLCNRSSHLLRHAFGTEAAMRSACW